MNEPQEKGTKINEATIRMVAVFGATLLAALLFGILNRVMDGIGTTLTIVLTAMVSGAFSITFVDLLRRYQRPAPTPRSDELITRAMEVTATTDRDRLIDAGLRLLIQQSNEQKALRAAGADPNAQTIRKDKPFNLD